jgi:hypothetical protein
LPSVDPNKKWQEWTEEENNEILNAFRGRSSVSWLDTIGSEEEKEQMLCIESEVEKKASADEDFENALDPFMVIVAFGGAAATGTVPGAWAGQHAASPVPAALLNGSNFVYNFGNREQASVFLGYVLGLGYHGWLITYRNACHH